MTTPGRASFAGLASQTRHSPSFRDIARLIVPSDREKAIKHAVIQTISLLFGFFILASIYAVNVVLCPFIRPLILATLFGSLVFPIKRSLALFFRRILREIREDEMPILASVKLPVSLIDRSMELIRDTLSHYAREIINFCTTILLGDFRSTMAVCLAAMSFVIIGGDSLMNFVLCFNLIIFVTHLTKSGVNFSDAYLQFLIRSFCLAQILWLRTQIIYLLLPIVIIWSCLSWLTTKLKQKLAELNQRQEEDASATDDAEEELEEDQEGAQQVFYEQPAVVKSTLGSVRRLFEFVIGQLDDSIDTISSACVIGFVALIVIFTALYLSFQIYGESVYLIEKISISANRILDNNPDLKSLLPDGLRGVHSLLDGAVKNTYQHGREWIKKSTRQLLNNAAMDDTTQFNTTQSNLIEKQMVEFWDRAYGLWLDNRANETTSIDSKGGHRPYDYSRLFDALQSLNFSLCAKILKQNWDTWVKPLAVLKGNLSIVLGLVWATLSLVIVGGNALVNFIIDLIIFTTALFYLLCASEDEYKPIELIKALMPRSEPSHLITAKGRAQRNEFLNSVDESINAVFTASLKMMAFHGLSTWLLHRLFEIEVVYIPSVISAIFGAMPIVSPYWSSVPACFDLWLSGHVSQAVLMLILATIPSSFVTTAFYSEIKGTGHPYLTGLAIAGGVFVFGIEGALFGPMLLVTIRLFTLIFMYFMDGYK